MTATIYQRRNGDYGSSYGTTQDTGHHITERNGKWTVFSIKDDERIIAKDASKQEALAAIERDWLTA